MVSNQMVTPANPRCAAAFATLTALLLAAGCKTAPPAAEAAPAPAAASTAPVAAREDNAIEVALASAPANSATVTSTQGTAGSAQGPAPVLNARAPLTYTVKRGDTLWDISAMYLRDPWLWPEIWHVNPSVPNPHLIYPGDVLALGYGADGRPQVTVAQGSTLRVQPLVRSKPLDGPISTIPYEAIAAFLGKPGVVTRDNIKNSPKVAAMRHRHVVAGEGQEIYVEGLEKWGPGRYAVVHVGDPLINPENGKAQGFLGVYTATAEFAAADKVAKGLLIDSARETQAGDLLFAVDMAAVRTNFVPRAAPAGTDGQIMAVVDGVSLIGQYQVVALNRGSKHGLEPGHVLAIDQKGERVYNVTCRNRDGSLHWCMGNQVQLPDERAGTLLVFKTYEDMSFGLVVYADVPVRIADIVRTP